MGSNPTVTNLNELLIYYNKYGESIWFRVDSYNNSKSNAPQGDDSSDSKLYTFNTSFKDPKDYTDSYFTMTNGDNLCVVESSELLAILDDIKCGVIVKTQIKLIGRKDNRWSKEFKLDIENRDFSVKPFKMGVQSFPDQSISQDLVDVLNIIFGFDPVTGQPTTRDDLGGILFDGTIIAKYDLLCPTMDVQIFDTEFGARETVNEYCNSLGLVWRQIFYPNPTMDSNVLKPIAQVQIWQNLY